jgi:hypothetical protein
MPKQSVINYRGVLEVSLTILPGLGLAIITNNHIWLFACFFAVCAIMPFRFSYNHKFNSFLHLVIIYITSFCLINLLKISLVFCLSLITISFILGFIEFSNNWLKTANSYLFIGILYSTFRLQYTNLNYIQDIQIFLLSTFSIALGLNFSPKPQVIRIFVLKYNFSNLLFYAKYVLPVTICLLVWRIFDLLVAL